MLHTDERKSGIAPFYLYSEFILFCDISVSGVIDVINKPACIQPWQNDNYCNATPSPYLGVVMAGNLPSSSTCPVVGIRLNLNKDSANKDKQKNP